VRQVTQSHAELLLDRRVILVRICVELCTNDRDGHNREIETFAVLMTTPFLSRGLLDLSLLLGVKSCQRGLSMLANGFEPEENTLDRVTGLGQINHYADSRISKVATCKCSFEKVREVTSTTELVDISLHSLIAMQLQSGLELECGRFLHLFLHLPLVEELIDE